MYVEYGFFYLSISVFVKINCVEIVENFYTEQCNFTDELNQIAQASICTVPEVAVCNAKNMTDYTIVDPEGPSLPITETEMYSF